MRKVRIFYRNIPYNEPISLLMLIREFVFWFARSNIPFQERQGYDLGCRPPT